jgi:hypothetical protein
MRDLPVDMLMGWDSIRGNKISILYNDTAVLHHEGKLLDLPTRDTEYPRVLRPMNLVLEKDVVVPPGAIAYGVNVAVEKLGSHKENWKGTVEGIGQGDQTCVVSMEDGRGVLPVWNSTTNPMVLRKGTGMCAFVPHTDRVLTDPLQALVQGRLAAHALVAALPLVLRGRPERERMAIVDTTRMVMEELLDLGELGLSE